MVTNLPADTIEDSAANTKLFFEKYGEPAFEYSSNDVQFAIGFFSSRGFSEEAANLVAMFLLRQAKINGSPVSKLLDTLTALGDVAVSRVVAEVLNNNRIPTSILGFKTEQVRPNQIRNIAA